MTVRELTELLFTFNPDAQVHCVYKHTMYPLDITYGGSEGCSEMTADDLFFNIDNSVDYDGSESPNEEISEMFESYYTDESPEEYDEDEDELYDWEYGDEEEDEDEEDEEGFDGWGF